MALFFVGCANGGAFQRDTADSGDLGALDSTLTDARTDTAAEAADSGSTGRDSGVPDPCTLPIPTMCFGRNVVFREWGPTAAGDVSYFADQAPTRLGFNRARGAIYITRFRTDENTYYGSVSVAADARRPAISWVGDAPCSVEFSFIQPPEVMWSLVTVGETALYPFTVVRNEADGARLRTDVAYRDRWAGLPQLRAGTCYYLVFANASGTPSPPVTASGVNAWIATAPDECGTADSPYCYYLAFDLRHTLYAPGTGAQIGSAVIAGLTMP